MTDDYNTYAFKGKVYEWRRLRPRGVSVRPALGFKATSEEIRAALKSIQNKRAKGEL